MSGSEKFVMGYTIANASVDLATSGFRPIGAISSVQDATSIARTIRSAIASVSINFATWEKASMTDSNFSPENHSSPFQPRQPTWHVVGDAK
jgi:hypothetical protein